jgi:hypothetical protein
MYPTVFVLVSVQYNNNTTPDRTQMSRDTCVGCRELKKQVNTLILPMLKHLHDESKVHSYDILRLKTAHEMLVALRNTDNSMAFLTDALKEHGAPFPLQQQRPPQPRRSSDI